MNLARRDKKSSPWGSLIRPDRFGSSRRVMQLGETDVVPSAPRQHGPVRMFRWSRRFELSASYAPLAATNAFAGLHPSGDEAAIARRSPLALSRLAPRRVALRRSR